MATALHRVHQNIAWRIAAITPTCARVGKGFVHLLRLKAEESGGASRGFTVRRSGRGKPLEPTCLYSRWAEHSYRVDVHYSGEYAADAVDEISTQDAHDIVKALRDTASWVGYDSSHTTDDIGIRDRDIEKDELLEQADHWILRLTIRCMVREVEG